MSDGECPWSDCDVMHYDVISILLCHATVHDTVVAGKCPVPLSRMLSANQYELAFVAHRTASY